MGSEIVVCGRRIDIGHPVVTFDAGGYNAYQEHRYNDPTALLPSHPAKGLQGQKRRYRKRRLMRQESSLDRLRSVVRQVIIHHDGCRSAQQCFRVLHDQHGLSVHFMVDNDGTVYQTLDLLDCAYHCAGVNEISVGIEVQSLGFAQKERDFYRGQRKRVVCEVHGSPVYAYDFDERQYTGLVKLCSALSKELHIPLISPRHSNERLIWTKLDEPRGFEGFMGHYHTSTKKWDPGAFDFNRLIREVDRKLTFPLTSLDQIERERAEAQKAAKLGQLAESYYDRAERLAPAYFPVGPFGRSRLWHGGVHLVGKEGQPIYAPLHGQLVLARMVPLALTSSGVGSINFILLRHQLERAEGVTPFFSLYYHLDNALGGRTPGWLKNQPRLRELLETGEPVVLTEPIEAGQELGRIGLAGPVGRRAPQLHFAIFSQEELGALIDPDYWTIIQGAPNTRFCRDPRLVGPIEREGIIDDVLSEAELNAFFSGPERSQMRRLAVRHQSEWTDGDWLQELSAEPEFSKLDPQVRKRLVESQIKPGLWWTSSIAAHLGLPRSGYVYSYHPITFLLWYRQHMLARAKLPSLGLSDQANAAGLVQPSIFNNDADSTAEMTDDEDILATRGTVRMLLEEIIGGYPEE